MNAPISSSSSIAKLFELNGHFYAQISTGAGSVISKYDAHGNQIAVNNQNSTGGPAGHLKALNGKAGLYLLRMDTGGSSHVVKVVKP